MTKVLLEPTDPRVFAMVLERIAKMTREEWIEQLQLYPDFDPKWLEPPVARPSAGPRRVSVRRKGARSRILVGNGAYPVPGGE